MKELIYQISTSTMPIILLSIANNFLTALIKKPFKKIIKKKEKYQKYSKYLTFLPVIIGAILTLGYLYATNKEVSFDIVFINTWVKNTSLSLAMYAFEEKFIPNEEKILNKKEINENKEVLENIKELVKDNKENQTIILKGERKWEK